MSTNRWSRGLVMLGLAGMLVGAVDPLEGSLVILPATALVALGALGGEGRRGTLIYWSLALVVVGVGALWGLSALGGFGGSTGRSWWWGVVLLPYPVGWLLGLFAATLWLRESFKGGPQPAPQSH